MKRKMSGLFDRNGKEIGEGDRLGKVYDYDKDNNEVMRFYRVCYGNGTFDSGAYMFVGFYLEDEKTGETDGLSTIMFHKDDIEVIS